MKTLLTLLGIASVASLLAYGWLRQDAIDHARKEFHLTMLQGNKNGYILTPPEFVAQPFIRRIEWSPDGNYAMLIQTAIRLTGEGLDTEADMRHRVLLWSRKTKRLTILWESATTRTEIDPQRDVQIVFFKDTPACLFAVLEEKFRNNSPNPLWSVYHAPLNGRAALLGQFERVALLAPPEDTWRYLLWQQSSTDLLQIDYFYAPVSPAGKMETPRPMPSEVISILFYNFFSGNNYSQWYFAHWHADGKQIILSLLPPITYDEEQQQFTVNKETRYVLWNPRTNQQREIPASEARRHETNANTPLRVDRSVQRLQHQSAQGTTQTTWLSEGEGATLVAADSALAQVSPQGDAILYVAHGTAFYRRLITISREDLARLQEQADAAQYVAQGKQIALALMMYAQDYDETFPPNFGNEGVAEVILPYLRTREVFNVDGVFAFRYLMNGQSLANINSPAETEIGYLQLPNGRVILYADGHVKFKRGQ